MDKEIEKGKAMNDGNSWLFIIGSGIFLVSLVLFIWALICVSRADFPHEDRFVADEDITEDKTHQRKIDGEWKGGKII